MGLILLFFSACNSERANGFTLEDFYVYDKNGEVVNYPDNERLIFYDTNDKVGRANANLFEKGDKDYTGYYTKRGVSVASPAKVKLKKYDLTKFYIGYGDPFLINRRIKDSTRLDKINEYKKKYPSKNEQVLHTNELGSNIDIYLSSTFYIDEKGKLKQFDLDELGNIIVDKNERGFPVAYESDFETYKLTFSIREDNIYEWSVEHKLPQKRPWSE